MMIMKKAVGLTVLAITNFFHLAVSSLQGHTLQLHQRSTEPTCEAYLKSEVRRLPHEPQDTLHQTLIVKLVLGEDWKSLCNIHLLGIVKKSCSSDIRFARYLIPILNYDGLCHFPMFLEPLDERQTHWEPPLLLANLDLSIIQCVLETLRCLNDAHGGGLNWPKGCVSFVCLASLSFSRWLRVLRWVRS